MTGRIPWILSHRTSAVPWKETEPPQSGREKKLHHVPSTPGMLRVVGSSVKPSVPLAAAEKFRVSETKIVTPLAWKKFEYSYSRRNKGQAGGGFEKSESAPFVSSLRRTDTCTAATATTATATTATAALNKTDTYVRCNDEDGRIHIPLRSPMSRKARRKRFRFTVIDPNWITPVRVAKELPGGGVAYQGSQFGGRRPKNSQFILELLMKKKLDIPKREMGSCYRPSKRQPKSTRNKKYIVAWFARWMSEIVCYCCRT